MPIRTVNISDTVNQWKTQFNNLANDVGNIDLLSVSGDSDLVQAINSLDSSLGNLSSLTTVIKTNLVAAVNSLDSDVGYFSTKVLTVYDQNGNALN